MNLAENSTESNRLNLEEQFLSQTEPALADLRKLRLKDVLTTLPKECFQQNRRKAWTKVIFSVLAVGLSYWALALSPWFLLPVMWFVTGTALTGFFVIAHDCGHRSFAKRRWLNDFVGHTLLLPLIYPFHSWRLLHDRHHNHTNKLDVDNAWQPFSPEFYDSLSSFERWGYRFLRGRLWWLASIVHWAKSHFSWWDFEGKEREQVRFSAFLVLGFAAIAFPTMFATLGLWGIVKFWLMPWLGYHFWMSTFTLVHHTAPHIPFHYPQNWHPVEAQLAGTVHCDYPTWVEWLCHDINVHIPHHLSTAIPSYNLRLAHQSLKQNWGSYLQECRFSWQLMKEITDKCHLYDKETNYLSCAEYDQRVATNHP